MTADVKVLCRMLVLRGVTTGNVPANQAHTEVYPAVSHIEALLTNMGAGCEKFNLVEMCTFRVHRFPCLNLGIGAYPVPS